MSDLHPLKAALLVALGGGGGALTRYYVSVGLKRLLGEGWPYGTFAVNLLGCLALGVMAGFASKEAVSPEIKALVMVGFLGAFTTFSTFSLDGVKLFKDAGAPTTAALYIGTSVLLGLVLAFVGYTITRS